MRTTTNHIRVAVAGLVLFTSSVRLLPMLPAAHAAPAIKSEAKAKLTKGGELYKQGRYDDAVSEFLTGYSIDPAPVFLYALGQAERKKGDCAKANEYYKSFLQTSPGAAQAQAA